MKDTVRQFNVMSPNMVRIEHSVAKMQKLLYLKIFLPQKCVTPKVVNISHFTVPVT